MEGVKEGLEVMGRELGDGIVCVERLGGEVGGMWVEE